jgi:hypothetical protein
MASIKDLGNGFTINSGFSPMSYQKSIGTPRTTRSLETPRIAGVAGGS